MSTLLTDEHPRPDVVPGSAVVVRTDDGYLVRGRFIGLTFETDGAKVRVLPDDRIERRVPMPCRVTAE